MATIKTIISEVFVGKDGRGFRMSQKQEVRGKELVCLQENIAINEAGLRSVKTVYQEHYKGKEYPIDLVKAQCAFYTDLAKNKLAWYDGTSEDERHFIRKFAGISPETHNTLYQKAVDILSPKRPAHTAKPAVPFKS